MSEAKPPVVADLVWTHDLRFEASSAGVGLVTDGASTAGPSPVQLLAIAIAGCMAMDVVDIVRKGRHDLQGFRCRLTAERAPEHPHRVVKVLIDFQVEGPVPEPAVQRAIDLSRDKYCSVWNSLREDIPLATSISIA